MATIQAPDLKLLYEQDETAWLEAMAALAANGHYAEMDFSNLSEFLTDMAKRDRREVKSRLVTLMTHLLKWEQQPGRRSDPWRATIMEQRRELGELLESGALRNHAGAVLNKAHLNAREQAAAEAELSLDLFSLDGPRDLSALYAAADSVFNQSLNPGQ